MLNQGNKDLGMNGFDMARKMCWNTGFKAYWRPEEFEFSPFSVAHEGTLIHYHVLWSSSVHLKHIYSCMRTHCL